MQRLLPLFFVVGYLQIRCNTPGRRMLDNLPTASPTTAYPASGWTSYRTPRYPSKWFPVDRHQDSDTEPAAAVDFPEPIVTMDYTTSGWSSYRTPRCSSNSSLAVEPQQNSLTGLDAISDNSPEPLYSMDYHPRYHLLLPTPTTKRATTVQGNKPEQPKCTACWTELDQSTMPMPCGHCWCSLCIVRRFTKIRNQTEWPVRCHHTNCIITLETAKPFLLDADIQRLTPLIAEFETAVMDRVYCSNTKCSIFVARRDNESRVTHCEACQTNTCSDCKGAAHESDDCPLPDKDEQKALITSHKEGWQRCTRCGQMCERVSGCSSIACPCGYNFCYHCAGPIYSCDGCPEIDNDPGLTTRAERRQRKKAKRTSRRQNDFQKEFAAFTTRRARARTNDGRVATGPETPYQQRQRLEDENFAVMMEQIHRRLDAERAQMERNRAERARREQSSSIAQRIARKIQRLCGRVFGL